MKNYALSKEEQLINLNREIAEIRKSVTDEERLKRYQEAMAKPINIPMNVYKCILKEYGMDCEAKVKVCHQ